MNGCLHRRLKASIASKADHFKGRWLPNAFCIPLGTHCLQVPLWLSFVSFVSHPLRGAAAFPPWVRRGCPQDFPSTSAVALYFFRTSQTQTKTSEHLLSTTHGVLQRKLACTSAPLILEPLSITVYKFLKSPWQLPTQTLDIVSGVDSLHDRLQPRGKLRHCLRPGSCDPRSLLLLPDPCDSSFVNPPSPPPGGGGPPKGSPKKKMVLAEEAPKNRP